MAAVPVLSAGCTSAPQVIKPEVVEAVTYTEAEMLSFRAQRLDELAAIRGLENPPEVDLIRFIPLFEFGPTMVDCLAEQGYDVQLTPDKEGVDY